MVKHTLKVMHQTLQDFNVYLIIFSTLGITKLTMALVNVKKLQSLQNIYSYSRKTSLEAFGHEGDHGNMGGGG